MREYCEENQNEAQEKFFAYGGNLGFVKDGTIVVSSTGDACEKIIYKCMQDWEIPLFDTYNYEMVVYCIENQVGAYNRLNPASRQIRLNSTIPDSQKLMNQKEIAELIEQLEGKEDSEPTQQQENKHYTEPEKQSARNILYETGTTIKLHNPADTVVAIYKDPALRNMTIFFTNGISATVLDYTLNEGKQTIYNVRIKLKDGSEYKGWVPENIMSRK